MSAHRAQRGTPPVLQNVAVDQLQIDARYQRQIDGAGARLIRRIATGWDWSLCQPLVVARRPDGGLYVIDGQHRLVAAIERGDIAWLPCVVVDHATPAGEAAAFVAINAERRPLSAMALFRADVAAGTPAAVTVQSLVDGAGLRLTGAADHARWKPGWISHVASILATHRVHGDAVTRRGLEALASGFPGEILRHCGTLWQGIVPTIVATGADYSGDLMTMILRGVDQAALVDFVERLLCGDVAVARVLAARAFADGDRDAVEQIFSNRGRTAAAGIGASHE